MARGFGSSASGRACHCEVKDKANWEIIGTQGRKRLYIVISAMLNGTHPQNTQKNCRRHRI